MDKIVDEIIKFWGKSLKKLNTELINESSLSTEIKQFVTNVGLPINNDILINFSNEMQKYIFEDNKFVVIGDDFGTKICINQDTNEIFSVDDMNEFPIRFVNSNIKNLLGFLMIYIKNQSKLGESTDKEAIEIANEIREEYNKIDSKALSNDENWWSVILEQTEQGLM